MMKVRALTGLAMILAISGCSKSEPEVALNVCGSPRVDDGQKSIPDSKAVAKMAAKQEVGEVVREISWQLCNARTNKWIDDEYFRREMTALREDAFATYGTKPAEVKSASSEDDLAICLTAAADDEAKQAACRK